MNFPAIYLASRSPRRRELLQQIAVDFAVITADIDESVLPGEAALDYVRRIAIAKAQTGLEKLAGHDLTPVLAADTAVILDKDIFGKPVSDADARRMLKLLSGQTHQVMTAVALVVIRPAVMRSRGWEPSSLNKSAGVTQVLWDCQSGKQDNF